MKLRRRCAVGLAVAAAALTFAAAPSDAAACTLNEIACENALPGADPSTWQIDKAGDETIQGFATSMSVDKGETIAFKIKSETPDYRITILRLGYYGGKGARVVASNLAPTDTAAQPECRTFPDSGLFDCGNWSVSRTWTVPPDAVSGVYIAHLRRLDTGGASHITFVVRDDASDSDVVVQTSDATWQAYNTYGGNSLYDCVPSNCPPGNPTTYKAAYKVSYNRPLNTAADDGGRSALFTGGEYPLIRFLEANGYDVSYVSGVDVHRRGHLLRNHALFISSGHDEYWSATQRESMEAARDAGTNLAFFTGNTGFWKTRWEPSAAGPETADRTLVSYKDTHFPAQEDPVEFTGTWRDPRLTPASAGILPENALTGQSFLVNSGTSRITVPAAFGKLRMWRNTAAATLTAGTSLALAPSTLGYEWDVDADNPFRPAGQFKLSSTTASGLEVFTDYGSTVKQGATATHNLTMYKARSGARVFNSGTVQWSWGLDDSNPNGTPPDRTMQQATVNLFADLGAQPATRLPGLVAAAPTTDTTAPTSSITTYPATIADGARTTLRGTAADTGGGVVAGVEVSTDGGETWHPATGTTSWSYSWLAHGSPTSNLRVRAVDDSGNLEAPGAGVNATVTCPCSIWGRNVAPPVADSGDPTPVEVGVRFRSERHGRITGIRFYKAAANTGTHTGSLWSESGQRLAQVTFANETTSGWQTATFSTPVTIEPNTTYVASYHAPNGHYAATADYFHRSPAPGPHGGAITDSPPLRALRNTGITTSTTTNGVFAYAPTSAFPTSSYAATNYWVDVVFTPTPPPGTVANVTAAAGGRTSANVTWSAPTSGGAVTEYRVTPYAGDTALAPRTVTGTPPVTTTTVTGLTTGTTYTFRVQAVNPNGTGASSAPSNPVTPLTEVAPAAPTGVTAVPATRSARVSWSPPASDGDSPITGYTVTPYAGSVAQPATTTGPSASSVTVDGLTNGTAYTFRVAATNAVGTGPMSTASPAVTPQSTLFDLAAPSEPDAGDPNAIEVGVKFRPAHDGTITGIRFFKSAANTGTHTGSLWTADGQRLRQVTFTGESASGWQTASFATPVPVTAGTTYVASYHAPLGHYAATTRGLADGVENGPLRALADSASPNGVYAYGATSTFPAASYRASNYWVDVMYAMAKPGQVTGVTAAAAGTSSATLSWTAPATGGPVTSYRITPYAGTTAQAAVVVGGTPPATSHTVTGLRSGTTYRFTVQALNANGSGPVSAQSNAVTPSAPVAPSAPRSVAAQPASGSARVTWSLPASDGDSPITRQTVIPYLGTEARAPVDVGPTATAATVTGLTNGAAYTFRVTATNAVGTSAASAATQPVTPRHTLFDFAEPGTPDSGDGSAVELGVKFTADFPGSVTGIRFYKSAANTGTHTGSLWTASGDRITSATFTGESATGWQSVTFPAPVDLEPGTTYVASYHAPNGRYAVTGSAFASSPVVNGPLRALSNVATPNGVFAYGPSSFPSASYNAANYWVDVLFAAAPAPGQVTGITAAAGQSSATVSWSAPADGGPVTSYELTPHRDGTAAAPVTLTGTPPATTRTVTGLEPGVPYTFTVRAANLSGRGPASAPSEPVTPLASAVPGAPTGVTATADARSAVVRWTAPAEDGGSAITGYTVTPFDGATALPAVDAGADAASARVTGLASGTSYTFRVEARNAAGSSPPSPATDAVVPRDSIFGLATPGTVDAGDGSAIALGVKFRSDVAGEVTGVRFYKAAANTGTHVGSLWSADGGPPLAQATFSGETASGWQALTFPEPVKIVPGATYVAAYHAPNGHYSVTGAAFATAFDAPPLHALANAASPNGVYAYSATPVLPTSNWNATNYWVDVLFAPGS